MKNLISTAALLLSASAAFAQVKVVTEISVPAAPSAAAISATNAIGTLSMIPAPALTPSLAAPSVVPAAIAPVPAAAPAPITAQAALVNTGTALAAASKGEGNPAEISRRTFDAASKQGPDAAASPVAGGEYVHNAGLEGPDFARRFNAATKEPSSPAKTAAWETVEVGATTVPFLIAAAIMKLNLGESAWLIPSMLALWGAGFWAMRSHLSTIRRKVVGGWQASHDQRYRVDPSNGQLKDVRGHKYGEDRYEEYQNGPVGRTATALIGAAAVLGAAAFLLL